MHCYNISGVCGKTPVTVLLLSIGLFSERKSMIKQNFDVLIGKTIKVLAESKFWQQEEIQNILFHLLPLLELPKSENNSVFIKGIEWL